MADIASAFRRGSVLGFSLEKMPQRDDSRNSGRRSTNPRAPRSTGARRNPSERGASGSKRGTSSTGGDESASRRHRSEGSPGRGRSQRFSKEGDSPDGRGIERGGSRGRRDSDSDPTTRDRRRKTGAGKRRGAGAEPENVLRTEADRRRAAVRARGGGAARDPKLHESSLPPIARTAEVWIDEGPVRTTASAAVGRGRSREGGSRSLRTRSTPADPGLVREVARAVDPRRATKLAEKLEVARVALERERYSEAKRIARSLLKELSGLASVHEIIGLASYRLGQWRDATSALEMASNLSERVENLPVLADCYRAQRRWTDVYEVWRELKEQSPAPDVMAEGRIVMAGSLADRGELSEAIELMRKALSTPRRVREYHLRQWYVLADLYDRAGDIQRARELFARVMAVDADFADVRSRVAEL